MRVPAFNDFRKVRVKNKLSMNLISAVSFLMITVASSFCCGHKTEHSGFDKSDRNVTSRDSCDSPDAPFGCYFANMPSGLSATMMIPVTGESADRLEITGTVSDKSGKPVEGVVIYAYHTDSDGYYSKSGNESGVQKWHGKLHGWCVTDSEGKYRISTIRPAPYPGNLFPAHIHAALKLPDGSITLINDYVFSDDPMVNSKYESGLESLPGGTGIMKLQRADGKWTGVRDIDLLN